jgi:hypothetical protein
MSWAINGFAQPVRDCVTMTCTVRVDDLTGTPAVTPTLCRLYRDNTTLLNEVPAVPPFACIITRNYAPGTWSLTMRYATATLESPNSNVLLFQSMALILPTPTGFRFQ